MRLILQAVVLWYCLGTAARPIAATAGVGTSLASPWSAAQIVAAGQSVVLEQSVVPFDLLDPLSEARISAFPLPGRTAVDLELEKFTVFDDRTQFVESAAAGDVAIPTPTISFWRGVVSGDSNSIAFLALTPQGIDNGYVRTGDQTFFLASDAATLGGVPVTRHHLSTSQVLPVANSPFCHIDQVPQPIVEEITAQEGTGTPAAPTEYLIDVALVGTLSFFNLTYWDSECACTVDPWTTAGGAAEYMATLVAASNVICERDLSAKLYLSYCRVWTSSDPFTEVDDNELDDFENWWESNMSGSYQVISKITNSYSGGIAWVDGVCSRPYSVCGVDGYFPRPLDTYDSGNWDVIVTAHEWGHTLGSPHTHCYDPPIDKCYGCDGCNVPAGQLSCTSCPGSCYEGPSICDIGTIMSYCHLCGGIDDINLNFGTRVEDHIRNNLSASPCVSSPLTDCYVHLCSATPGGYSWAPYAEIEDAVRRVTNGGNVFICGVPEGSCTASGYPVPFPNGYPGSTTDAFPPGTIALPCVLQKWTGCSTSNVVIGQ